MLHRIRTKFRTVFRYASAANNILHTLCYIQYESYYMMQTLCCILYLLHMRVPILSKPVYMLHIIWCILHAALNMLHTMGPRHFIPPSLHFWSHFIPKGKIVTSYRVTSYQGTSYQGTSYQSHFIPCAFHLFVIHSTLHIVIPVDRKDSWKERRVWMFQLRNPPDRVINIVHPYIPGPVCGSDFWSIDVVFVIHW